MKHSILLVDDDLSVLQAICRNWRKQPFQIRTATHAEEALAILARDPVDAVICDWHMPGMCGTEFLASVARYYPDVIRIMLTGKATFEIAQGAINNAAVHKFLLKPFDAAAIAGILEETLKRRGNDGNVRNEAN